MNKITLKSLLVEAILDRKIIKEAEDDDIPYAEEIPDDEVPKGANTPEQVLKEAKEDYAKAKKYVELEAVKLMSGTSLIDLIEDTELARKKEKELEGANDSYDKRCSYYDDKIDEFHEEYGYNNKEVDEIGKYSNALGRISQDLYDAAQVWYKLKGIAEEITDTYQEEKRMKAFVSLKSTQIPND